VHFKYLLSTGIYTTTPDVRAALLTSAANLTDAHTCKNISQKSGLTNNSPQNTSQSGFQLFISQCLWQSLPILQSQFSI